MIESAKEQRKSLEETIKRMLQYVLTPWVPFDPCTIGGWSPRAGLVMESLNFSLFENFIYAYNMF